MKKYFLITLLTMLTTPSFSANSASAIMTASFTTVPNNYIDHSFDFSSVPFTKDGNIKTYNIDNFAPKGNKSKSSLVGSGIIVSVDKFRYKDKTIIDIIF
jgi:hypothetical protein